MTLLHPGSGSGLGALTHHVPQSATSHGAGPGKGRIRATSATSLAEPPTESLAETFLHANQPLFPGREVVHDTPSHRVVADEIEHHSADVLRRGQLVRHILLPAL